MKKVLIALLFSTILYASSSEIMKLQKGWNLVGFPKSVQTVRRTFSNEKLNFISDIYKYNQDGWISYSRDEKYRDLNDFDINSYDGVWIKCDRSDTIGFNLENATSLTRSDELPIEANWNLLSIPTDTTLSPKIFEDKEVFKYSDSSWQSNSQEDNTNKIKTINDSEGMWIKSNSKVKIAINDEEAKLNFFSTRSSMNSYIKEMININYDTLELPKFSDLAISDVTTTNLQEEEVDEDDFVKVNKTNLFFVNKSSNSVYVYNLEKLIDGEYSEITIDGVKEFNIETLLLTEDKLIIISRNESKIALKFIDTKTMQELKRVKFDGSLITSRLIDNSLFLISGFAPKLENEELITPKIYGDEVIELYNPEKFYAPIKLNQSYSTINLTKIDLNSLEMVNSSLLGDTYTQYVSKDSIYLISLAYPISYSRLDKYPRSIIYKFSTKDLEYKGDIFINGQVLNQFSLSEINTTLRIATHTKANSSLWSDNTTIYTIKETNSTLAILDSISIDEYLTAIRFLPTKAFFTVSSGNFYTIDLSDEREISKATKEFNIDGTSLYFHHLADDKLLSIGRDLDEYFIEQNLTITLFDISDSENITLLDKYDMGNYCSEAETNHKAFNLNRDYIFTLPITKDTTYLQVAKIEDSEIIPLTSIASEEVSIASRGVIFKNDENRTFVAFVYNGKVKVVEVE